ncbi:MAG TPA: PHB depolymerase family esterase [Casimicrobiaceae bacterium]|nr:PHB depolymerase family esterase [Casimicrobiaceae bacterium]
MNLWTRVKATFARWFGRASAGYTLTGAAFTWRGWLSANPWAWPRRGYRFYVPAGASRWRAAPLIVLLHGCKQSPEEIARGTRIEALADELCAYVLMPRQVERANPYRCWNWFEPRTIEGRGEAAIVLAAMRKAMRWRRLDATRTAAIGISAGAALAAILGIRHAERVRAVVTVAGLACGASSSPIMALTVRKRGPDIDVAKLGLAAFDAAPPDGKRVALLAIHGRADDIVAPRNSGAIVRQYLARNEMDVPKGSESSLPEPDHVRVENPLGGHAFRVRDWQKDGALLARLVEVDDLGHAWSGGDASVPFNVASPPDATAMAGAFLDEVWSRRPA